MRTKNTIRNLIIAWGGQIIVILCNFISRKVFVQTLPQDYLGINGLFSNILSILSLADLGIGASIGYYLYEPLAKNDHIKIAQIVQFFRRIYILIGTVVLVFGIATTPFIEWFINGESSIEHLKLIYFLYVVNSAISYFNAYKLTLITADQKKYLVDTYTYIVKLVVVIVDIIVLYTTRNYIIFYSVQIVGTILVNLILSLKANKLYPYINSKDIGKVSKEFIENVKQNTIAMIYHKIGNVVVNGTDNLIISKMVNVFSVGLYSNYTLITLNVSSFLNAIYSSVVASIGSYNASESKEKKVKLFDVVSFFTLWLYSFCAICFFVLLNPFITLWLGEEYLLEPAIVFVIVLNLYLQGIRKAVLTFRDALGIYRQDKYKAVIEAIINLVVSVLLASKYGMIGVFIGTTISTVFVCLWVEPYVLYKYGFGMYPWNYYFKVIKFTVEAFFIGIITTFISSLLGDGIIEFILKLLICCVLTNLLLFLCNFKSVEFKLLMDKVIRSFGRGKL